MPERVEIPGSQRKVAPGASPSGAVDSQDIIQVTVVLRRQSGASLPPLEQFGFRPAQGAAYHSREDFAAQYGADPADMAAVEAFATDNGLTVSDESLARRSVVLEGTVADMQKAFGTTLRTYSTGDGGYRGRTGPITVPAHLEGIVTAVLGLDNRQIAKAHIRRIRAVNPPPGFTPAQVAKAYSFPANATGAGQTIGIIELGGGFSTDDLNTFFHGKSPNVTAVLVDGGTNDPGADTNADGEVMLDIEVAGSIAPAANIVVYFAPNTDQGFHDAITTAVHDTTNNPSVISISWGGPEDSWTAQSASAMLEACSDAAGVGVTITAAAGDDGASDGETDGKLHVDLPACLPPVLACGGTKLTLKGSAISSEVVWNELASQEGATGGGVSNLYALPSYQTSAGVPVQPETSFKGRGVPDVAGDADPNSGYAVLVDGQSEVIGGTSAVAPLWAGLIALLNEVVGKPVGFVQPALYQIGESAFRDITSGNNNGYTAGKSWDACTGLGTPNGAALAKALSGATTST